MEYEPMGTRKMPDNRKLPSPNCTKENIPVEFLVLHYTAVDLQTTLNIFLDPQCQVSAHLVIGEDGSVIEMVDCMEGKAHRAWHAGESRWESWQAFNDFSIGIELVNLNGNLFEFTDAQYESLKKVVGPLQQLYPALEDAGRVVGHEHIAGFRGKADPGYCFDWQRFYQDCYPDQQAPERTALIPEKLQQSLRQLARNEPADPKKQQQFWVDVSRLSEVTLGLILQARLGRTK